MGHATEDMPPWSALTRGGRQVQLDGTEVDAHGRLAARLEPDFARIEIRDTGRGFDPDVRAEARGYGLRLTDMLATRWGVDRDDTAGTRVWFEVDRRRRRFSRSA